jgi:hypothetical protein
VAVAEHGNMSDWSGEMKKEKSNAALLPLGDIHTVFTGGGGISHVVIIPKGSAADAAFTAAYKPTVIITRHVGRHRKPIPVKS